MESKFDKYKQHQMKHEELSPVDGVISPYIIAKVLEPHNHKLVVIKNNKELAKFLEQI